MRVFMVLGFIAVASAARLGYNYQPGSSGRGSGISISSSGSDIDSVGSGSNLGLGGSLGLGGNSGLGGSSGFGGSSGLGGSLGLGSSSGSLGLGSSSGLGGSLGLGSSSGSLGLGSSSGFGGTLELGGSSGLGGSLGLSSISGIGSNSGLGRSLGLSSSSGLGVSSGLNTISGLGSSSGLGGIGSGSGISDSLGLGESSELSSSGGSLGLSSGLGGSQIIDGGLTKEFLLFSAPEEDVYNGDDSQRAVTTLKRNLQVIFIKAPENNGVNNAVLNLARQAYEDRTAIYVLSKQPDISELADQVQQLRSNSRQRPEVRFIKYRTPEDALNAQRSIQQEYDGLGGPSKIINQGIAPILNYASASEDIGRANSIGADLGSSGSASNLSPSGLVGSGGRQEYLPPVSF